MGKKNMSGSIFLLSCCVAMVIFAGGIKHKSYKLKDGNISINGKRMEEEFLVQITEDKSIEENEKDCVDDEVKKNLNPYFFPDDITLVEYDIKMGEDGALDKAKLYVYKEKTFYNGILYSLIVRYDVGQSNSSGKQEKESIDLGYFYVQANKIYLIRDRKINQDISENELIENGTVICQPGGQKEDHVKSRTLGWHEYIKESNDVCAFFSYNDLKKSEFYEDYEYFIWQKGRGLVSYRTGYGEEEKICLQMKVAEQTNFMEGVTVNPYFFSDGVKVVKYDGYYHFKNYDFEKHKLNEEVTSSKEIELSICVEEALENGILYSMEIKNNGEFYFDNSEWGEKNREYLKLGFFYVQKDKIYLIRDMEIEKDIFEEELIEKGTLVCQSESKEYPEWWWDSRRKYWNEYINIIGDRCEFYSYETRRGRTTFVESFKWQKGIGLVEYYRGTSFDEDDILIYFN